MAGARQPKVAFELRGQRLVAPGRPAPDDSQGRAFLDHVVRRAVRPRSLGPQPLEVVGGDVRSSGGFKPVVYSTCSGFHRQSQSRVRARANQLRPRSRTDQARGP